jgi:TPR repeat protein
VEKNLPEAVNWFRKADEGYWIDALRDCGSGYEHGDGSAPDYVLAHMWFGLAAAQGDTSALSSRDHVAALMTGEQLAEAKHLEREWKKQKLWGKLQNRSASITDVIADRPLRVAPHERPAR